MSEHIPWQDLFQEHIADILHLEDSFKERPLDPPEPTQERLQPEYDSEHEAYLKSLEDDWWKGHPGYSFSPYDAELALENHIKRTQQSRLALLALCRTAKCSIESTNIHLGRQGLELI